MEVKLLEDRVLFTHLRQGATGFPGGLVDKESTYNSGDADSIPGSGRSPGGGHSNLLHYSYLENSMNRGDWRATVHGDA